MSDGNIGLQPPEESFSQDVEVDTAIQTFRPASPEELAVILREQVSAGLAIYPRGGAVSIDYGGLPRRPGVSVETRNLAQVIDYPHADMTITVQAGITATELASVLAENRQRLLVDVPRPDQATLGGVFATATCGPRRFAAGRPRDQIIGISFATSTGSLVKGGGRVVKNVAGYDLPKLLTGSLGTLGVITQLTLKVRPIPEESAIVWLPLRPGESIEEILVTLNTSGTRPMAVELLNPPAARSVGPGLHPDPGAWALAIGLEDNAASVRWQINRLFVELGRTDLEILENEQASHIWAALVEFQEAEMGPLRCKVSLRPSEVVTFAQGLDPDRWAVQAHAGNGILWLHALGSWMQDEAKQEIERLRSQLAVTNGTLVVARCPASWKKSISVWGQALPDWRLAEQIKEALDPPGAMNPGRFVGRI